MSTKLCTLILLPPHKERTDPKLAEKAKIPTTFHQNVAGEARLCQGGGRTVQGGGGVGRVCVPGTAGPDINLEDARDTAPRWESASRAAAPGSTGRKGGLCAEAP